MWLEVGNNSTRVTRASADERRWLRHYLSFPDPSAFHRGAPANDRVFMFNLLTDDFPSGFVPMVVKASKDPESTESPNGFQVDIIDRRVAPAEPDPAADLAWLRDYQLAAVKRVYSRKRGILWLRTGAGKTEIAVALARSIPCHWLFVVHRTGLADDAAGRFTKRNAEHGVDLGQPGFIGEGVWTEGDRLTCASFQTLAAGMKRGDPRVKALLRRSGGMIVDECHTLPAASFWGVATSCPAFYRVGLSGTPLARGDQRSIFALGALGPVIYEVKAEELIEAGMLAKPTIRMATITQPPMAAPWPVVYDRRVVKSQSRNAAIVKMCKRATPPCLLFVKEIAHGRQLVNDLLLAGVRADFVYGKHSLDWRKSHVNRLVKGHFDVLVCSVIFQEGVDIPSLRSVVIGNGGQSIIATLQRIGRGMRPDKGKQTFEVWDILDKGDDRLERHAKARLRAYTAEGYDTIIEP